MRKRSSITSSSVSARGPKATTPAAFTRPSRRPCAASAAATTALPASASRRSAATSVASIPIALSLANSRAANVRLAPCSLSCVAIRRPMPPLAPITMTEAPSRSRSAILRNHLHRCRDSGRDRLRIPSERRREPLQNSRSGTKHDTQTARNRDNDALLLGPWVIVPFGLTIDPRRYSKVRNDSCGTVPRTI